MKYFPLTLQCRESTLQPNFMKVAKLSGITNIAIKALEITRFNIKILVVIFRKFLFEQITYTTEKFNMIEAAITKTRRTSCATCTGDCDATRSSIPLWFVISTAKATCHSQWTLMLKSCLKYQKKIKCLGLFVEEAILTTFRWAERNKSLHSPRVSRQKCFKIHCEVEQFLNALSRLASLIIITCH